MMHVPDERRIGEPDIQRPGLSLWIHVFHFELDQSWLWPLIQQCGRVLVVFPRRS